MKNLRKLNKGELKRINGGRPPLGCNNWDPEEACCRSWAEGYCGGKTCPNSPPPYC
ncbi:bacteriocin-like protein [Chryseobacterium contaminans]|uniref:bacteriocin-like protein n=1 Tax=Chryseobacterium contaminans TaxID=1423959 RepID=UPI0030166DB0